VIIGACEVRRQAFPRKRGIRIGMELARGPAGRREAVFARSWEAVFARSWEAVFARSWEAVLAKELGGGSC